MAPDPDPDAPAIHAFTPAEKQEVRPYLPPTWGHYVHGDFYGLQNLATSLYDLALKGNPLVDQLRGTVNKLLDRQDGVQWSGRSAGAFRASYGQDSSMLSALDKIVAATAGIVDHLAEKLATLEHAIEQEVSEGLEKGYFLRGHDWEKTGAPRPNLDYPGSNTLMSQYVHRGAQYIKQAQEAREIAAQELAKIGEVLLEMLNYYRGKSKVGQLDPGGLLRQGQVQWYSPRIDELSKQLKSEKEHLEGLNLDAKTVGADMQKIGGGAQTVGDLMGLIGPLKPAGETVNTVGGVVSQLGEVTEHFGK